MDCEYVMFCLNKYLTLQIFVRKLVVPNKSHLQYCLNKKG